MRFLTIIFLGLSLCLGQADRASAQMSMLGFGLGGKAGSAYVGPGDLVPGALLDYSLRGYNAAYSGNAVNVCLPADAACADIPVSAGNLVIPAGLSTCNNSTVLCTIKTWYNQNDTLGCDTGARCDFTQATIASRAAFIVPLAANGCTSTANYCAGFTASTSYTNTNTITGLTAPYTLSAVAVRTSGTSYSALLAFNTSNDTLYYGDGANKADLFAGADHLASQTDGSWHAMQALSNGASSSLNIDGSQTTFTAAARNLSSLAGLGTDGVGDPLTGKISELIAWPSAISAGNITAMNSNQHTYWGF